MSKDRSFWVRIALTSLVYNLPLAAGYVYGVLSIPVVLFLAAAGGVASLALWERPRSREPSWEPGAFDAYA